ncbi:MAG TPA: hypothetical protein VGI58_02385 [Streptosporangiaceae bacterium]|jgi:hypothetical protein
MSDNYADLTDHSHPQPDVQALSGTSMHVYEAVATIEYSGRRASREAIAAAAGLDEATLEDMLTRLTEQGALALERTNGDQVYVPTSRGWSAQPELAAAHHMR